VYRLVLTNKTKKIKVEENNKKKKKSGICNEYFYTYSIEGNDQFPLFTPSSHTLHVVVK